jgi:hypothetical protein
MGVVASLFVFKKTNGDVYMEGERSPRPSRTKDEIPLPLRRTHPSFNNKKSEVDDHMCVLVRVCLL